MTRGRQPSPYALPHLVLVREALRLLVPRIRRGILPPPPRKPWNGEPDYDAARPLTGARRLACRAAVVYGLPFGYCPVVFREQMNLAGRVQIRGAMDYLVELSAEMKYMPSDIAACLGHELGHVFLYHHGLWRQDELANEILTDVTAILYGFGIPMVGTHRTEEFGAHSTWGDGRFRVVRRMGYLTPAEMGYVLARSSFGGIYRVLRRYPMWPAVASGRKYAMEESATPPLRTASTWSRLVYRVRGWWTDKEMERCHLRVEEVYAFSRRYVLFRCPMCSQVLRLERGRSAKVRCPNCGFCMWCDS